MSSALNKAAWVDRVFTKLSKLDPNATIEQLQAIAEESFAAADAGTPEAWAERYFRTQADAGTVDREWRLAFWERAFELEPRLSLMEAWDLWETAAADPVQSVRTAQQAAEHFMGTKLPPMTDGSGAPPALHRGNLVISVAGASPQEIERARAAVHAMFEAAEVTPTFAARSAHKLESWGHAGFPPEQSPSKAEFDAAQLWFGVADFVIDTIFGSERPANASSLVEFFLPPADRMLH
jgi:hypothetical protein